MVANVETYRNLQATLYFVHLFFPDIPIVVYDLGLNEEMRAKVNIFSSRFKSAAFLFYQLKYTE
jgi:hypothetical protein